MAKQRWILSMLLVAGLLLVESPAVISAEVLRPLLMSGKQALYQRVLAKPGARAVTEIGSDGGDQVIPFSIFYVYERKESAGQQWVKVGLSRHGEIKGWIRDRELIPWAQGLTVAFRDPLGNDRVLLFRDRDSLKKLAESHDLQKYEKLYAEATRGALDPGSPVVAIQPEAHVDIVRDFYLVPIRRHEDIYLGNTQARLLEIASVPLADTSRDKPSGSTSTVGNAAAQVEAAQNSPPKTKPAKTERYRSGLVFVVDATVSMDPYIERTREAVRTIFNTIAEARLEGDVSFGLVAYQDSRVAVPKLDYLTRTYATLEDGRQADRFFARVNEVRAAKVSSRDFVEDAYAGVKQAIEAIDWSGHAARYLVLVTDAGARGAQDPLGSTGMSADTLRQLAQDKGIAIFVLHLLTPEGAANHADAADQYRRLALYPGIGSLYYGVKTGEVGQFGYVLDALAQQITEQVRDAARGSEPLLAGNSQPKVPVELGAGKPTTAQPQSTDPQLAELQAKVAKLGYALRMQYLQRHDGAKIPDLFNAWLVDRDFRDPQRQTLDVRVLLTRDQLSDLHYVMRQVLETAEEGLLSPRNFLNDLKSLAATLARDPEDIARATRTAGTGEGNLADMGFMREYIEDLPYAGEVMSLSLDDWQDWSAKQQLDFIHRLEEKITYYEVLHDHTDLWVSLDGGPISGESVFPIALELLP